MNRAEVFEETIDGGRTLAFAGPDDLGGDVVDDGRDVLVVASVRKLGDPLGGNSSAPIRRIRMVLAVGATDGEIGRVDVLLDDDHWTVRHLVVQPGRALFLDGHRVLISPISFRKVEWSAQRFHLTLTMDKIKNSPDVDVDKPVSRQHERDYYGYYGFPLYWRHSGVWGMGAYPGLPIKDGPEWTPTMGVHREFERRIHEYYGRPAYWSGGQTSENTRPPQDTGRRPG